MAKPSAAAAGPAAGDPDGLATAGRALVANVSVEEEEPEVTVFWVSWDGRIEKA